MAEQHIDPITFSLFRNAFDALVDEMAYTIIRTARSEIVKDVMDYSTAFCDAQGHMLAQGKTIALHLGAVPDAISAVIQIYEGDLYPGDVIVLNDPYLGGMHLPDIFMFKPVFFKETLCGFAVAIAHHTDVGGRVPGSNASDSTEIFQEGLRIPPLKLYNKGVENKTLFSIIGRNVRVPDRVLGDLRAQYAACVIGEREYLKLIQMYGLEKTTRYQAELLDYAERMTRAEIAMWPDGEYSFTDYIDDDGFQNEPIPISVKIKVAGDILEVDFEGTSPQVKGAINSTFSYTKSCTYLSVKCALNPDIPNNAGVFRAIHVKAPRHSVVNPDPPAPCAARALTGYRIVDAMFGALHQILPNRIPAAGEGGNSVIVIGGYREAKPFIMVDMICGAWGGRPGKDGIDAITNPSQNLSNTPVEILENNHPVIVEEYAFLPDSCGAGEFRGGLGIVRQYRLLHDEAILQVRADRVKFAPYGLAGGRSGKRSRNIFNPGINEVIMPGKFGRVMQKGDVIRHEQAGGGGFGDPLQRSPEKVLFDVLDEKISLDCAFREYGVVIDAETMRVDQLKTIAEREARKSNQ